MRICVYVHMWPPVHCAGSEVTVHVAMREMAKRGHSVTVIADQTPTNYEYEGVQVLSLPRNQGRDSAAREIAKDADVLVTHLDCTSQAMMLALDVQKPLVHFVHNHAQLGYWHVNPLKAQLIVFNSHWIANNEKYKGQPWPGKSVVIHPIIEPDRYKCERGEKITFCNPTEGKGVETVHKLAESMPDYEFLIVEGIYGEQVAPPHLSDEWVAAHPNIEHMKNTPDFREVLRKTKVLLMPSNYESYGRCAVEAACAGIPSIVHPTQGLWEALANDPYPAKSATYGVEGTRVTAIEELNSEDFKDGLVSGAGIFCLRYQPQNHKEPSKQDLVSLESWRKQIERLYQDGVYYRSRSDAALKLASSFNPKRDFDRLEDALLLTSQEWKRKDEVNTVKMWTSDRRLWETTDGKLVAEKDGRIPRDAIRLACGVGGQITEEAARANGLLPTEVKAINAPEENKAMRAPEETKAKTPRKKVA